MSQDRCEFLQTLATGALGLGISACGAGERDLSPGGGKKSAGDSNAEGRPNIMVILADDMGFSDLGCYGGEIDTPNVDGLAVGGFRFTQFYNASRCCPTRARLLTGQYPHNVGVGRNGGHHGPNWGHNCRGAAAGGVQHLRLGSGTCP